MTTDTAVDQGLCRDCEALKEEHEAERVIDELSASDRAIFFAFYDQEEDGDGIDARQLLDRLHEDRLYEAWAVDAVVEAFGRLGELGLISADGD